MTTALVQLVISTPVCSDEITTEAFIDNLRANAEIANARVRAIANLATMGWTLLRRPEVVGEPGSYQDVITYWRKDFPALGDYEALRDMRAAGASGDLNFSLLWGYHGHDDEHGPAHMWGLEGPSRD